MGKTRGPLTLQGFTIAIFPNEEVCFLKGAPDSYNWKIGKDPGDHLKRSLLLLIRSASIRKSTEQGGNSSPAKMTPRAQPLSPQHPSPVR